MQNTREKKMTFNETKTNLSIPNKEKNREMDLVFNSFPRVVMPNMKMSTRYRFLNNNVNSSNIKELRAW